MKSNKPFLDLNDFVSENRKCLLQQNMIPFHYNYTSCAISDSVFSRCSSTAFIIIKIMIIHVIKNSTCGMRVHVATLFIGLPQLFALNSPKFRTFETQRSIVL